MQKSHLPCSKKAQPLLSCLIIQILNPPMYILFNKKRKQSPLAVRLSQSIIDFRPRRKVKYQIMDVFTPKYVRLMSPPHCPSIYLSMDFYWVGDDRNSQDWTLTNCTVKSDSIRLELAKIEKKICPIIISPAETAQRG